MQTNQAHTLDTLRRVQRFLDENANKVTGFVTPGARTTLDTAVSDLNAHLVGQANNTATGFELTKVRDRQRRTLVRDRMAEVVRMVRVVIPAQARSLTFRMPHEREAEPKLASRALEMAEAAAQHEAALVAAGLAPDFVATLRQSGEELIASREAYARARQARGVATNGLREQLSAAAKMLKVLDVQVRRAARTDPDLLKGWQLARRIVKSGAASTPATPAPVTPGTVTSAPVTPAHPAPPASPVATAA